MDSNPQSTIEQAEVSLEPGRIIRETCPICGMTQLAVRPFRYAFRGRFLYGVTCCSCSLTFVHPQPSADEIEAMYGEEYFTENSDEVGAHGPRAYMEMAEEGVGSRKLAAASLDERIMAHTGGRGRLLEIGCGPGFFLAEMRSLGWDVSGLELSEFAARHAGDVLGLDVVRAGITEGAFAGASFDAVFMGDVLEHLAEPVGSLGAVHEWLRPGGVAAIAVPSTLNLVSARLGMAIYERTGRCKTLRIPPYHLFEYTPHSLRKILETAGFRVTALEQSAVPLNRMGLRGSLAENAGKVSFQILAHATAKVFNRGGDRLLALAVR